MRTSEVLEKAAEEIERSGWNQGSFYRGTSCCLLGAIGRVTKNDIASEDSAIAAFVMLSGIGHPSKWNDAPERTAAEVIAALRAAAAQARTSESP